MAKHVTAVVNRGGYVYRGVPIPKGRVVRMDKSAFDASQRVSPSFFREAKKDEIDGASTVLDLASVEAPTAQNVVDAEAATSAAPKK